MKEFFLATKNNHKLIEFQSFLQPVKLKTPADLGINFLPNENGKSFFENAIIKANLLYDLVHKPVLADDSGLCVDALNGKPGIFSARYSGQCSDRETQDKKNIEKLLTELDGVQNRTARFVCCVVAYFGAKRFFVAQETCEGLILENCRGEKGFGYDPVFFIPQLNKTMAEISTEEKNLFSHRGKALAKIQKII